MKQIMFVLFVTVIGLISCKDNKKTDGKETAGVVQDTAKDSAEIRRVITSFYNWYDTNYRKLLDWPFYSETHGNSFTRTLHLDVIEKYQQYIRDSVPQLGEQFLSNQKHFFQQCDSAFKKDTEEGVPFGFDYDWYTNSQEETKYTTDMVNANKPWPMKIEGDHARVQIGGSVANRDDGLIIYMKKENGKWTIAKIGDN